MSMLLQCVVAQRGWVYTMQHLGFLADSLIIGQPDFFIFLARFTSSWRSAVPEPVAFICIHYAAVC